MLNTQQQKELSVLLHEYTVLSNKAGKFTKYDEARAAYLQTAISTVKAGGSLTPTDSPFTTHDEEAELREFQKWVLEYRGPNATEGAPMNAQIGAYSGLGTFVKTFFQDQLFVSMKQFGRIFFDDSFVTLFKSTTANPLPVPIADDTENNLAVIAEAGSQTQVDVDYTNHAVLNGYIYNSSRKVFSVEAFQDLQGTVSCVNLFKKFLAESFARGLTADLLYGNGVSKPLGLIPSLIESIGVTPIIAQGAGVNDGAISTAETSVGSLDIQAMFNALDDSYDNSHTAWLGNRHTLAQLATQKDAVGNLLRLVQWDDSGNASILGIPYVVSPSMESASPSAFPLILGDFSYFATRIIVPDGENVQIIREAPGLIENGNVGMCASLRGDGAVLWSGSGPAPFIVLQNHS
jgi:HK97 family phage major capsid protein